MSCIITFEIDDNEPGALTLGIGPFTIGITAPVGSVSRIPLVQGDNAIQIPAGPCKLYLQVPPSPGLVLTIGKAPAVGLAPPASALFIDGANFVPLHLNEPAACVYYLNASVAVTTNATIILIAGT